MILYIINDHQNSKTTWYHFCRLVISWNNSQAVFLMCYSNNNLLVYSFVQNIMLTDMSMIAQYHRLLQTFGNNFGRFFNKLTHVNILKKWKVKLLVDAMETP